MLCWQLLLVFLWLYCYYRWTSGILDIFYDWMNILFKVASLNFLFQFPMVQTEVWLLWTLDSLYASSIIGLSIGLKELCLAFCCLLPNAWPIYWYSVSVNLLGLANMVYPGAVHSRFEHSLGVYWLAGEAIHKLKSHQVWNQDIHSLFPRHPKKKTDIHSIRVQWFGYNSFFYRDWSLTSMILM